MQTQCKLLATHILNYIIYFCELIHIKKKSTNPFASDVKDESTYITWQILKVGSHSNRYYNSDHIFYRLMQVKSRFMHVTSGKKG